MGTGSTGDVGSVQTTTQSDVAGANAAPQYRVDLADRIRELIEESVRTRASEAGLRDASRDVAAITAALRHDAERPSRSSIGPDAGLVFETNDPVEGPSNPMAPPLSNIRVSDAVVYATATLGTAYEGAPGRAHGGWVASLLDHAVGRAAAAASMPGMTVSLTVDYHDATPHSVPLDVEARFVSSERRKVHTTASIQYNGRITASAKAILVAVDGLPDEVREPR